ncbi:hypothetical protein BUALT_Bualt01G0128400 [Buddleja alternifolia]|uniref:Uncharacterized protein n=1 Tax=Buddleja alternifolia TaxID=168488 RepID=A0AAV6Y903_9LAMI|nr:hypothetical protein BUALT_Bualt01G0128400 [Buddleja alternifolia]
MLLKWKMERRKAEIRQLFLKDKRLWFASFLIAWAAALQVQKDKENVLFSFKWKHEVKALGLGLALNMNRA